MSQPFDCSSYGAASSMQHNGADSQGEADVQGEADDDDDIEEESRGRRLAWTEQDNIRLMSSPTKNKIYFMFSLWNL